MARRSTAVQRQVMTLPGSAPMPTSMPSLPLTVPPAPIGLPISVVPPGSAATVRSPSHTPLYSRSRSNGPRSTSSYTPNPYSSATNLRTRSVSIQPMRDEEARHTPAPPPPVENKRYAAGLEVEIGEHRFRCLDVLGKGSYSEVWRGEVLKGGSGEKEVALKEVRCSSQVELQQAIFEVQVLLALERSASSSSHGRSRVPRCISYKVDPCNNGWKVRTSMTVVPGESLDVFIRHKVTPGVTRESATKRAVLLSAKLLRDISPTLQLLAPIAWHRDVNSHNILIDTVRNDSTDVHEIERLTSFWLIDFGLAVDSQSWVTMHGRWRTEDIGGDSRYWPPSSWIMHLLGPEGFRGRPELCEQYQRRLDIHGLGITALELLCTLAHAAPPSETQREDLRQAWEEIFAVWHRYREDVWRWWAAVYSVFSAGGDIAPVQAKMVQDRVVEQLIILLTDIRHALRHCAPLEEEVTGYVLSTIADMIDEQCTFELTDIPAMLGDKSSATAPVVVADPRQSSGKVPGSTHSSVVFRNRPRSPSPGRPKGASLQRSTSPHGTQVTMPWPAQDMQASTPITPATAQTAPYVQREGPIVVRQVSPSRGRSPLGARSPQRGGGLVSSQSEIGPFTLPSNGVTPRDGQRSLQGSSRPHAATIISAPGLDHNRLSTSMSLDTNARYKSASAISTVSGYVSEGGRFVPRSTSMEPQSLEHRAPNSFDRSVSPQRRSLGHAHSLRAGSMDRTSHLPLPPEPLQPQTPTMMQTAAQTQWTGVLLPVMMSSQQRQASALRERQLSQSGRHVDEDGFASSARQGGQGRDPRRSNTPLSSPSVSTRKMSTEPRSVRSVLPVPPSAVMEEPLLLSSGQPLLTVSGPHGMRSSASGARLRAISSDGTTIAAESFGTNNRSPRPDSKITQSSYNHLRAPPGPLVTTSSHSSLGSAHIQRSLPTPWLPPPRELSSRSLGMRSNDDQRSIEVLEAHTHHRASPGLSNGREAAAMASRLTEAMAGLSAAVAAAQHASAQQTGQPGINIQGLDNLEQSGDGDVGAGPPYPSFEPGASELEAHRLMNSQELKERMRSLEAGDEHEKLRERIKNLEESLQRLGRESLERAKLGMEKLAEKYFPKVRGPDDAGQSNFVAASGSSTSVAQIAPHGTSYA